ncbi:hypothetical protein CYY_005489 [Polysphondylium violaceum]|uniref:Uncharacterized protein n=1 Tax=Polysphondylium violaceum TaxID=133409 RepID=A0A8J4PTG3_9MYCE|nr:hypothetical protein CYY_005489 [Polysphondylium violaceum]
MMTSTINNTIVHSNGNGSKSKLYDKSRLESLFIYQNFDRVILDITTILFESYHKQYSTIESFLNNLDISSINSDKTVALVSQCDHQCQSNSNNSCDCIWMMQLLIQSLYEKGLYTLALKFINSFYRDGISNSPFDVLILSIHLLVHYKNYEESKAIILEVITKRYIMVQKNNNQSHQNNILNNQQYEQLVELLIFHIMFRLGESEQCFQYLESDHYLSSWKKEGFIQALNEMIHIKEIEEKSHKELQQKQQKQLERELQDQMNQLQQNNQQQQLENQQKLIETQKLLINQQIPNNGNSNNKKSNLIVEIKQHLFEIVHEILTIRDFESLKTVLTKTVYGNIRKLLHAIITKLKSIIIYLKSNQSKQFIKKAIPGIISTALLFYAVYLLANQRKSLAPAVKKQKLLQQQQQQQLLSPTSSNVANNTVSNVNSTLQQQSQQPRRSFGLKNVSQQQQPQPLRSYSAGSNNPIPPSRYTPQYQQYSSSNRPSMSNNNNTNNTNSYWSSFKQLVSNSFTLNNRVE